MLYYRRGSVADKLSVDDLRQGLSQALDQLGPRKRVLVIPPDFTRFHSQAGRLTRLIYDYYGKHLTDVLPALGTHTPMTSGQIAEMYARSLNPNAYTIRKDMFDRAVDSISQAKSPEAYKATLQSIYEAMNRERQAIQATQKQIRGEPAELPDPFAAKGGSGPGGTTSSGVQWSVQP